MEENLSLYHIFFVTAECGNISRASNRLFISQPAVSKSIRKLEENLNVVLFHRTSRGVTLTEDGLLLYEHVREAFSSLHEGEELLARKHGLGVSRLRIGVSTTLCKYLLLPYLRDFIPHHPHVRVTISCQSTYRTMELLEDRKIDVGLIGEITVKEGYDFRTVRSIEDTFVATRGYLQNLTLCGTGEPLFSLASFMMLDEGNVTRQWMNGELRQRSIELENVLEVSTMDLIIEFARIGLGIGCVIREFVEKELSNGELEELDLGGAFPKRKIGLVYRREDAAREGLREFLDGF